MGLSYDGGFVSEIDVETGVPISEASVVVPVRAAMAPAKASFLRTMFSSLFLTLDASCNHASAEFPGMWLPD